MKKVSKSATIRNEVYSNPIRTASEVTAAIKVANPETTITMNDVSCIMSRMRRDTVVPAVMHQSKAFTIRNYASNNKGKTPIEVSKDLGISLNDVSCEMSRMKNSGRLIMAKTDSEVNKTKTVRDYTLEHPYFSTMSKRIAKEVGVTTKNASRVISKLRVAGMVD
jgi:hypothetical protein